MLFLYVIISLVIAAGLLAWRDLPIICGSTLALMGEYYHRTTAVSIAPIVFPLFSSAGGPEARIVFPLYCPLTTFGSRCYNSSQFNTPKALRKKSTRNPRHPRERRAW